LLAGYLQSQLQENNPEASEKDIQRELQWRMVTGLPIEETHLRTFARLLSYNSELLKPEFVEEQQSHWNGVSRELAEQSKISFFVPCLRMRWRWSPSRCLKLNVIHAKFDLEQRRRLRQVCL
jgi:hypothetical protein